MIWESPCIYIRRKNINYYNNIVVYQNGLHYTKPLKNKNENITDSYSVLYIYYYAVSTMVTYILLSINSLIFEISINIK